MSSVQPETGTSVRAMLRRLDAAFCARVALVCGTIVIVAGVAAQSVPPAWWGNWPPHVIATQNRFVDRFFAFDSRWYDIVAAHGYRWIPGQQNLQQDIAFFPLWPMILRLIAAVAPGESGRWLTAGLCAVCGVASIVAFRQVAGLVLAAPSARMATLFYALTPQASFLLLSYPTGLMNVLCLVALLAIVRGRFLSAAGLCGVAMAAGPLTLATAMTLSAGVLRRRALTDVPAVAYLLACAVFSVLGLVLFILWQWVRLQDGLAFVHAQAAWTVPLPLVPRTAHWIGHMLVTPEIFGAAKRVWKALASGDRLQCGVELENAQNLLGEACMLVGIYALAVKFLKQRGTATLLIVLQAWLTVALYEWFDGASFPGHATDRLIYPAAGGFIGIAWLLRERAAASRGLAAASALLLFVNVLARSLGYHII